MLQSVGLQRVRLKWATEQPQCRETRNPNSLKTTRRELLEQWLVKLVAVQIALSYQDQRGVSWRRLLDVKVEASFGVWDISDDIISCLGKGSFSCQGFRGWQKNWKCLESHRYWRSENSGSNLVLSHLSHVQLCVTLQNVACPVSLPMGFSRQEYCSGLPFPSWGDLPKPGMELKSQVSCIGRRALYHQHQLGSPRS